MSAILFIPATAGVGAGRRINFAEIAQRFAEPDEPAPRRGQNRAARIGLLLLILLGATGDFVLLARSSAIASCLSAVPGTAGTRQAT